MGCDKSFPFYWLLYSFVNLQFIYTDPDACYYTSCTVRHSSFCERYNSLWKRYSLFCERHGSLLARYALLKKLHALWTVFALYIEVGFAWTRQVFRYNFSIVIMTSTFHFIFILLYITYVKSELPSVNPFLIRSVKRTLIENQEKEVNFGFDYSCILVII